MANNSSATVQPVSGYDLAIYGLEDGSFYTLHTIAISALSVSGVCSLVTIVVSCRMGRHKHFFNGWQKRDRFVIYMAVCDGLYGICHLADHINVMIVEDHVYPGGLCVFYSFIVFVMMIAQNMLVNLIAINAFALMYFERRLDFGQCDWKLLSWIFGVPLICAIVSTALNKFGPTGAYCLFDGVTGGSFYLAMVSIPIMVILPTNALLYVLIWAKLYTQTNAIRKSVGRMSAGMKASHKAARAMALFVLAYFIQWWDAVLYGFWAVVNDSVPQIVVQLFVFFANIGGLLNLVVFIIIQRGSSTSGSGSSNSRSVNGAENTAYTCTE